jgi:chromosome condensin MukBEF complex kleisin-like MukF subunit
MDIDTALRRVEAEYISATEGFEGFHSAHEGYAVLLEEVDELWEQVKHKPRNMDEMQKEATHTAAMAIRFLVDCC